MSLLEQRIAPGPLQGRIAALYTLKQLVGADATPALVKAAADPALRAVALRALADRRGELANVPKALFVQALSDADPRVQLQAITGLRRMGATDAAAAMLPLTASADVVVSNVAINALVALSAIDAPLAAVLGPSDAVAAGAVRVLQQIHQPAAVGGLVAALNEARTPARRAVILQALARLHYREGAWRGTLAEWWGTRPDTTGPYYDPVAWDESARIRAVLMNVLLQATGSAAAQTDMPRLLTDLERNRLFPLGSAELLTAMMKDRDPAFADLARALVGRVRLEVDTTTAAVLERVARARPAYRDVVVKLVVAAGAPTPPAAAILQSVAVDSAAPPAVRASAYTAIAAATGPDALGRSIGAFAALSVPTVDPALDPVWRQFVSSPAHAANIARFREAASSSDRSRQMLGYAVLVQLAADPPAPAAGRGAGRQGGGGGGRGGGRGPSAEVVEAARTEARQIIDAAWTSPAAGSLVWAVGRVGATRYRDRVDALVASPDAQVRDAAQLAVTRLTSAATAAAPTPAPAAAAGPVVSAVPYEELVGRLAGLTGDVAQGRTLFTRQACAACHTITPAEQLKGPYLGGIFTRYSRAEVLESILRPAAKVAQGFASNSFTLTDKRQLAGFVVLEGPEWVVVRDITGAETTIQKSQIATRTVTEGSIMPAGLADTLTLQELASLLAFLQATTAK